uniref:Exonuclease domain-containing protein n=1 Tax=Bracon brevicornis TaxID=1563983 RepID=A0A6V7L2G8_9HYME
MESFNRKSNCGFVIDPDDYHLPVDERWLKKLELNEKIFNALPEFSIVYFDLETSGFERDADILEIAAKFDDLSFHIYATPTRPIHPLASEVTGLTQENGILYLNNEPVGSVPLNEALHRFHEFLSSTARPHLLVAHNAPFDMGHLVRAIIRYGMLPNFQNLVGFSDTLTIMKKILPDRKGGELMTLKKLGEDLLHVHGDFHQALFDVQVLQQLAWEFIPRQMLIQYRKPLIECIIKEINKDRAALILPTLSSLKGFVSEGMLKRIAEAGITYSMLYNASKEEDGLLKLLAAPDHEKKPIVTRNKKVLDKIHEYFIKENEEFWKICAMWW